MTYTVVRLTDEDHIRAYLLTDAAHAAYALGDLEPPHNQHAAWFAALRGGEVAGLALVYTALDVPALFLMGERPALSALLRHGVGPDKALVMCRPDDAALLDCLYRVQHLSEMARMRVTPGSFTPVEAADDIPAPHRLDVSTANEMRELLDTAAMHDGRLLDDIAFTPAMVASGPYFGIEMDGQLVAMAGTHLVAPGAKLAALGNVVVHPDYRSRGLATLLSSVVTQSLFEMKTETVVLNVNPGNTPAVRAYEKLGYQAVSAFVEGIAERCEQTARVDASTRRGII